jgi:hypothetical protein
LPTSLLQFLADSFCGQDAASSRKETDPSL